MKGTVSNKNMIFRSNAHSALDRAGHVLILLCSLICMSAYSVPALHFGGFLASAVKVVGALILALALLQFVMIDREDKAAWLKLNIPAFIYLIYRAFALSSQGAQGGAVSGLLFEVLLLIGLSSLTVDIRSVGRFAIKTFMTFTFIVDLIDLLLFLSADKEAGFGFISYIMPFIRDNTFMGVNGPACSMYSDMQTMGIMNAFALLMLALGTPGRHGPGKHTGAVIFAVMAVACILLSGSRTGILALVLCFVAFLIVRTDRSSAFRARRLVLVCVTASVVLTGALLGFIRAERNTGLGEAGSGRYTGAEAVLDRAVSRRYHTWKASYLATEEHRLLGVGSPEREKELRLEYIGRTAVWRGEARVPGPAADKGTRSGYLSSVYCTGLIGFILFSAMLISRVLGSGALNRGGWYLAVIFFLIVNFLEDLSSLSLSFLTLCAFMVLQADDTESEAGKLGSYFTGLKGWA